MDDNSASEGNSGISRAGSVQREFAWGWVWTGLASSLAVGVVVTVLLWGRTTIEHRDAFDAGWKSAAAILAILAAFITVDRLRLSQREHHRQVVADEAARDDAIARRITDLSSKASEQLGSDKATVRIGGLTDLERLGQAHPQLRQTVVDRICAYLRAPYQPPPDSVRAATDSDPASPVSGRARSSASGQALADDAVVARRLELDVRRTAQQILQRHLSWFHLDEVPPDSFWGEIRLDLRDAVLVEMDLAGCRIGSADFRNATFHGRARFVFVIFRSGASFDGATFTGDAEFAGARFGTDTSFGGAMFSGGASFVGASFISKTRFDEVTFTRDASFESTTFHGQNMFDRANFGGYASFVGATFTGETSFDGTTFVAGVGFGNVRIIPKPTRGGGVSPLSHTRFVWPPGWRVEPDSEEEAAHGRLVSDSPPQEHCGPGQTGGIT